MLARAEQNSTKFQMLGFALLNQTLYFKRSVMLFNFNNDTNTLVGAQLCAPTRNLYVSGFV